MKLIIGIIIILCLLAMMLVWRRASGSIGEKEFWGPFIIIIAAIATMVQANIKYVEVTKIDNKIRNIAESVGALIASNQAWANRWVNGDEALKRMEKARLIIDSYLDEIGTPQSKKKEILGELDEMIAKDKVRKQG